MSSHSSPSSSDPKACAQLSTRGRPDDAGNLVERLAVCLSGDLLRHARRRCGNVSDAEDAVQEALTVALRYVDGFRGDTSLRSWMIRLVNSACTRQRRGRRNDPKLHTSLDGEQTRVRLSDPALPADERLQLEEQLSQVASAVHALPDRDRTLLLQHEGEGVPLAELAEQTGSSVAAVRTRLYRARKQLRANLGEVLA